MARHARRRDVDGGRDVEILDVDLLAFERGTGERRRAVVDGVRRSLATGFVYTRHDLSEDLLDTAYGMLREFFSLPRTTSSVRRPGVPRPDRLHRPAGRDRGVERRARLEGDAQLGPHRCRPGIRCAHVTRTATPAGAARRQPCPASSKVLTDVPRRRSRTCNAGSCGSSPRRIGCHETFFDEMINNGATLTRAIRYPPMAESPGRHARVGRRARRHQPDHRAAAGHRARAAGAGRRRLGRCGGPRRPGDHQHRDDARAADQRR